LSTAPFEYITTQASDFYLRSVMIHSDVAILEDFSIFVDDTDNDYDTKIYTKQTSSDGGVTGATDLAFYPDSEILIYASSTQQIKLNITNTGLTGKVYVTLGIEVFA
jgi:hypothetical protein